MTKPLDSGTEEAQRKQIKTSKSEDQRHQSWSETCRKTRSRGRAWQGGRKARKNEEEESEEEEE